MSKPKHSCIKRGLAPRAGIATLLALLLLPGLFLPATATLFYPDGQICLMLADGHGIVEVIGPWGLLPLGNVAGTPLYLCHKDGVEDLEAFCELLESDPAVNSAEPNFILETPESINQMVIAAINQMVIGAIGELEEFEDQRRELPIGIEEAHAYSTGAGVQVAVLDTGIDPGNPAYNHSPQGFDLVDGDMAPWENANGLDDDGDGLVDEAFGHGSMVAGLVSLVAPDALIVPIRVLDDEGRTTVFLAAAAIDKAIVLDVDVIVMSYGMPTVMPRTFAYFFTGARSHGITVVSGAGNENRREPAFYPAAADGILMVTALDSSDVKADFADYHENVLVSAPGVELVSAYPGGRLGRGSGCSFAVPLVAGEAALILALNPNLDPDEVEDIIAGGVDAVDHLPGNAPYAGLLGTGRIYLPAALSLIADNGDGSGGSIPIQNGSWGFPNPAPGSVVFAPPAGARGAAGLSIFDVRGRRVCDLPLAGRARLVWDGRDDAGRQLSAGVYFARIETPERIYSSELILLR